MHTTYVRSCTTKSLRERWGDQMSEILNSLIAASIIAVVGFLWKIGHELTKLRIVISNLEEDIREIRKDIDSIEEDIDELEK